ncbi:3' terminal RNA ribose 2'-O-methyltransferase Hen1 [Streptomyces johnsoniae]|uniref:Small RNA 2'-O-methyltransferase n=1 Tax=Streptomyces johnsoniae TaxID=3075532 RepID=A0ABU2SAU9_9ACTN|nr:3' terminal RNA ribose 2'-O-methyltransferase Hen1 [Streptomyces sp. DSM 41886]MDT0446091.1 3' terminal RNA ribose 2'-O-methyltransferase Hen1 [Streptomyces sp. DSM 41886]
MFLTISAAGDAGRPATDLGFLLHKHPEKAQEFSTSAGPAHVFYPVADERRCTVALLLDVDPVALVRNRGRGRGAAPDATLAQYVNDRPYAASSLLAVALGQVFRTALRGDCAARPELPGRALPLRIEVPALPARGGADVVRRLFEPLGWAVTAVPVALDEAFPEWGDSRYLRLTLTGTATLSAALRQLYVLLPVLDAAKHYWITAEEVDKLLRAGDGWLAGHPEHRLIVDRYLAHRTALTRQALTRLELARLAELDDGAVEELDNAVADDQDGAADEDPAAGEGAGAPVPLAVQRRTAVLDALRASGASRVLDLGCGGGQLLGALLAEKRLTEVVGMDVSARALAAAHRRLGVDRMPERQRARLRLLQGSLVYTDARLEGYDAAVLCEVIEHVDPPRLPALAHAVFGAARPGTVIVTTPNAEYNGRWETLPAGQFRHADHRFEWTRAQFAAWAAEIAERYGYTATFRPVGPEDPEAGPPTQLAVFTRGSGPAGAPATEQKKEAAA